MFKFSLDDIRDNCINEDVYRRGFIYYTGNRVRDVHIDDLFVDAFVKGNEDYRVYIELAPDGSIDTVDCGCQAYEQYYGFCKHIVAVLLYLKNDYRDNKLKRKTSFENNNDISVSLIRFFESKLGVHQKSFVDIETTLEMLNEGYYKKVVKHVLTLRIGQGKMYVVKSIKKLIDGIMQENTVEFGKGFTFDPSINGFNEKDIPIIDFITELYEVDKSIGGISGFGSTNDGLFKGKYLYLTPKLLDRFLHIMCDKQLKFTAYGTSYGTVKVIKEDLPMDFLVKKSGSDLLLDINISSDIVPVTTDGRYLFFKGNIHEVSKTQSENFIPFYNAISTTGKTQIKFKEKDREKFVSAVLPHVKNAGNIVIDESVQGLFYQRPLMSKVYLDKDDNEVLLNINFMYGDCTINPFKSEINKRNEDLIVLRDMEKERKVLDIIEKSEFKINKDRVYLEEDDKIFIFITQYLPELQSICEIYYSEAFKKIKVYDMTHYKSSIRLNQEMDLLEFNFSIEGIDRSLLPDIFKSLRQRKKYYRLSDGSFLPFENNQARNMKNMIEYLDLKDKDLGKEIISIPKFKAMFLDEQLNEFESTYVERNIAFKELVQNIKRHRETDSNVPNSLKHIMRDYQVTGFRWLKTLAAYGFGGILADDMGLGKTIQTIAFIQSERERIKLPSIVVCPTSLVYNWESEVKKFAPSLKTLVVSGNKNERTGLIESVTEVDIVITSYPLIRRDIESYHGINFGYCILDEAQHIKNPGSVNALSVKEIRAKGYFALTGTPVENRLSELWSIFDFIMPGYLLSYKKFQDKFERPITENQDEIALKELNRYIKPFILRRLKSEVLKELPEKIESVLTADMTDEQKAVYLAYLQNIKGKIEEEIREKGFQKSQIQILAGLTRLRQICCHPSLFVEDYSGGSGKFDLLLELLEELLEGNHRILIFSQFTGVLKLIREELIKYNIEYFYLDGSTRVHERGKMVQEFNDGTGHIFLISLKAGGTGLNLTGADTVIHFDPWWNPAVEDQATDRAYRIGQKNAVQVMKLLTKGTIEEKIYKLQQKKKELIGSVLQEGETFISKMTEDDIRELFIQE